MTTPRDPTPAEIAAECARIREGWSEAEHFRRAGMQPWWHRRHEPGPVTGWQPPVVRYSYPE